MARFRVGDEIGRGGFCRVNEAWELDADGDAMNEELAVKRLRDDLQVSDELMDEIRRRFEREARLLDDILDHEHIVEIFHRNTGGDDPYIVMPRADSNVWDEVENVGGDEEWVCLIYRQILVGMAYAHAEGVIHRDLKPENALLYGDHVRLSDLGLGKDLEAGTVGLTKTRQWSGTEPFMAPEQFTAMKETGPAADVFSLGKLLIAMLTGEHPEVGVPDVSEIPERFRYFVSRCCEKNPENRFVDAKAALEAFDRVITDEDFAGLPAELLEKLVEAWFETPEGEDLAIVQEIDRLLRESPEEESLFTRQVPRLAEDIVHQYMDELPDAFVEMLRIYDRHVAGGLPFEYCDVVTDFYERLFRRTPRLDLRRLVVARLLDMGYSNNRWHVRTRLLTMLSECTDPSTVAMAADEIRARPSESRFTAATASSYTLPKPIREAFADIDSDSG